MRRRTHRWIVRGLALTGTLLFHAGCQQASVPPAPAVDVEVEIDDKNRPLRVISFFIDRTGFKIKHGTCFDYDWFGGICLKGYWLNGAEQRVEQIRLPSRDGFDPNVEKTN